MPTRVLVEAHPLLAVTAFVSVLPRPLADLPSPPALIALLAADAVAPVTADQELRERIRKMLRHGGYKPSGRGKPASEYLVRAAGEGTLGAINGAVDACNAASLHAGFPISVVDLDRLEGAPRVRLGRAGESYVFNHSGQTIDVEGLVVLADDAGPTANAVKDAQRTKTGPTTIRTLSIVWGTSADNAKLEAATAWYRTLVAEHLGATVEACDVEVGP
jgi:DNA/RNA-binding domain of Phe-tRNA-synthetase-like protein